MTLQIIKRDGKTVGIALLGDGERIVITKEGELWRICESCCEREAIVFCRTHAKYICGNCLRKAPAIHLGCEFISIAVARDLAQRALRQGEVEA